MKIHLGGRTDWIVKVNGLHTTAEGHQNFNMVVYISGVDLTKMANFYVHLHGAITQHEGIVFRGRRLSISIPNFMWNICWGHYGMWWLWRDDEMIGKGINKYAVAVQLLSLFSLNNHSGFLFGFKKVYECFLSPHPPIQSSNVPSTTHKLCFPSILPLWLVWKTFALIHFF